VLNRLMTLIAACLMLSSLQSCSGPMLQIGSPDGPLVQVGSNQPPATVVNNIVSSACGWDTKFYADPKAAPIEKRLTRNELVWLAAHNDKIDANCPAAPAKKP